MEKKWAPSSEEDCFRNQKAEQFSENVADGQSAKRQQAILNSVPANRRKFPRFTLQRDLHVLHRDLGKLVEISMGGMLFTYVPSYPAVTSLPPFATIFNYTDQCIENLRCETVDDLELQSAGRGRLLLRQRRIKFGDLSERQTAEIEQLILANARIPQLSYDARYTAYQDVYLGFSIGR